MPDGNASLDVNATSIFQRKPEGLVASGVASSLETPPLCCKCQVGSNWVERSFLPGKIFLKVGTDSSDCDLSVKAEPGVARVHFAMRLVLDAWFILECATERIMLVDGVKKPHATLRENESCIVNLGSNCIVLSALQRKNKAAPESQLRPQLVFKSKERECKIPLESSALIGSGQECRIIDESLPQIAGSIFCHHGRPYLHALRSATGVLTVDGSDAAMALREIREGSTIAWNDVPVFSAALRPKPEQQGVAVAPGPFQGNLALLDISSNRFGAKLVLPAAGRSLMIGRDSSNHFIIDSPNVSKKHAQLIVYDNSVLVLDARSTNGTYIEEEPIAKKLMHPGETVRFADRRYLLCHSD